MTILLGTKRLKKLTNWPVWVLRCRFRSEGRSKDLPQNEQGSIVLSLFFATGRIDSSCRWSSSSSSCFSTSRECLRCDWGLRCSSRSNSSSSSSSSCSLIWLEVWVLSWVTVAAVTACCCAALAAAATAATLADKWNRFRTSLLKMKGGQGGRDEEVNADANRDAYGVVLIKLEELSWCRGVDRKDWFDKSCTRRSCELEWFRIRFLDAGDSDRSSGSYCMVRRRFCSD